MTTPAVSSNPRPARTATAVALRIGAALLLAVATTPLVSAAQTFGGSADLPPVPYSRVISINPLLLVFVGNISADYEQRVSPSVTLGASIASFDLSKANYLSVESKARYYLSGRALDGVAISATLGVVSMDAEETTESSTAMSVGFGAERQWLVGPEERLALAAGLGAARLFFADESDVFRTVLPSLRLSIGWGF